jgi:hypothetical protein
VSRYTPSAVNLTLCILLNACAAATEPSTPSGSGPSTVHPQPAHTTSGLVPDGPYTPEFEVRRTWSPTPRRAVGPETAWPPTPTAASGYLPTITGARFARLREGEVEAAIAALPEHRRAYGIAGLTPEELFGDGGPCEPAHALFEVEQGGVTWEADMLAPTVMWLLDGPTVDHYALSEACAADLLLAGGVTDVASASGPCSFADERAHFPEGSTCRACLATDGDLDRCETELACAPTAPRQVEAFSRKLGGNSWFYALRARTVLCAPDVIGEATLLASSLGPEQTPPAAFSHGAYEAICVESWSATLNEPTLACTGSEQDGATVGDVVVAETQHFAPEGAERGALFHRSALFDALEVDGHTITATWLYENTLGVVSQPRNGGLAWGLPPEQLRPGFTDPTNPEQLHARDWIAGIVLKSASNRNRVPVVAFNHNRCLPGAWVQLADGRWRCNEVGDWSTDGKLDDGMLVWWNEAEEQVLSFPWVTLASTGLADPNLPGGFLPHIFGSSTLADPDWEHCAWPDTFEPDLMPIFDTVPALGREPYASFDGQTVRFDTFEPELRLALATSQRREFCPPQP